jgi:hypothetical protein
MLETLVDKMLQQSGKNEHLALLESVFWMQPHSLMLQADDWQEAMRIRKTLDHYYKQLNLSHEIKVLQQIDSILGSITTEAKTKYFENYMNVHLKQLIKVLNPANEQEMERLFWLF